MCAAAIHRTVIGLVSAAIAFAALPAAASAAGGVTVAPSDLQAGGHPSLDLNLQFQPGADDSVKRAVVALAPGLWVNLAAKASCFTGEPQLTPACEIGSASARLRVVGNPVSFAGGLYLVPPPAGDVAGLRMAAGPVGQLIGVVVRTTPSVGLDLRFEVGNNPSAAALAYRLQFNAVFDDHAIIRLPTRCAPATSTMTVTYYGATPPATTSSSFTPTGCGVLPFAPKLSAAATKDSSDAGVALLTMIEQGADDAAIERFAVTLPPSLAVNQAIIDRCSTPHGCEAGTASATSPLLPETALRDGTVTLGGTPERPTITASFSTPLPLKLVGRLRPVGDSLTFSDLPDIPLTDLKLDLTGAEGDRALRTTCHPGDVTAAFTAYAGQSYTARTPLTFTNRCAGEPTVTGSVSGLADRRPKLEITATRGRNAPLVRAVALDLPLGLSFRRGALVTESHCAGDQCETTIAVKGLGVSGAAVSSATLTNGKLLIGLERGADSVRVTTVEPLVSESQALQRKVREGQIRALEASIKVTDSEQTTSTLSLRLPV